MFKKIALLVMIAITLAACPGVTPTPNPPANPPTPGNTSNVYRNRADLDALAAEVYATDPARRTVAVQKLFREIGLAPEAQPQSNSVRATSENSYGASARQIRLIGAGLEAGSGTSLDAWAKQANALEYRRADGAVLDAAHMESQLKIISQLEQVRPDQRALALVAAISRRRVALGAPTNGRTFGDGELDALQTFLLNNSLLAASVLKTQPGQLRAQDNAADSLGLFMDFYGATKEILKDVGGGLERTKQAGEFISCATFLLGGISLSVKPASQALWYKGVAGKPFQSELGLEAGFDAKVTDDDLVYHASLKCAPTAGRRVTDAQVRWDVEAGRQHGELRDNEVTTDASGKATNLFTTHDEDTPESLRSERTAIKAKVRVGAALFGLSKNYPYIEYRSISIANAAGSTGTKTSTELDVTYYTAETYEGSFFWKWDVAAPHYSVQANGAVTWAPDQDGELRVVAGTATLEYVDAQCSIQLPKTVYDLAAVERYSHLNFDRQPDGSTAYNGHIIVSDQKSNKGTLSCPGSQPAPIEAPASWGVIWMIPKGVASFAAGGVTPELKGNWTGVIPEVDANAVISTRWDWKRITR